MKKHFSLTLLTAAILSGCGSDSNPEKIIEPVVEPVVNTAPQAVADTALVQNNLSAKIDVLANDTDTNGDPLTITAITTQPSSGTVEIVDNQLVYTPKDNVATIDTIIYEVSDGELTAQAEVAVTVNHTMALSGLVTDSPIANAKVSITIGEEVFEVEADAGGNYTLPVTINDMSALIFINATGSSAAGQENVELIAVAGQASTLLAALDEERKLTNEHNNLTNVTHVSTATYLLVKERTENGSISSEEEFNELVGLITPEKLMETAGFIKLLVDNADFDIPEGETVLSVLDLESAENEALTISAAIEQYLVENGLVDENGQPTDAFEEALSEAIAQTVSDPNVVEQFSADNFSNKIIIDSFGAKQGWNEYSGTGRHFAADGTGITYNGQNHFGSISEANFTWSVAEGSLDIAYQDGFYTSVPYIGYPFDELVHQYGFPQAIADELVLAAHAGLIDYEFQIKIEYGTTQESYVLLSSTPSRYQVNVTGESFTQITLPESVSTWTDPTPRVTEAFSRNQILVHTPESAFMDKTLADLEGNWALNFDDTFITHSTLEEVTEIVSDYVSISGATATTRDTNQQFTASLTDGVLALTQGDVSYKFIPFTSAGKGHLAQVQKWVGSELEFVVARQIAQFDTSYELYTNNLVTQLPKVQLAYINGSRESAWDGDKLKLEEVWGYLFNADGTFNRGLGGVTAEDDWDEVGNGIGYFSLGDDRWTWDKSGRQVNMYFSSDWQERHRTWEVISVDDDGRALVLEHSVYGWDYDNNGEIEDSEIGQFIRPRINTFKLADLSHWEAEWQNTLNIGLLDQASATTEKKSVSTVLLAPKDSHRAIQTHK
ncbi:Ig-like domain-containing protein [Shewanella sp. 10N.286.51.B2]|uniref:Ig-like domain-containing protein n=1 Tax=Shewanella sp. 10N.286.51.B2 TaxID=3229707 RepID=UPI00354D0DF2